MWLPLAAATGLAGPLTLGPALSTLAGPCLDDPTCADLWGKQVSEAVLETTYALVHEPVMSSAFGGRGMGLNVEAQVGTLPLGPRNDVQRTYPVIPAVPTLAVGWHLGSYTYETPYPEVAIGVHGLPPNSVAGVSSWALGGTASVAFPLSRLVWIGGEAAWNTSSLRVPIVMSMSTTDLTVPCSGQACKDSLLQHTPSGRLAMSLEPAPAWFLYGKVGLTAAVQEVRMVDGTRLSDAPVLPEIAAGTGIRAGDRFQLAVGMTSAAAPERSTTGSPWMTRIVASTGVRFGDARYHEGVE
ncbi:MAG: hypothetical protein KC621_24890 [Myxococcales bacterium]|nr:hypothetical protein [Myxococcales bacterium]